MAHPPPVPRPHRVPLTALGLLSIVLVMAGCAARSGGDVTDGASPSVAPPTAAFPLTITDDLDRPLTLAASPERIVSLAPSSTEIVCALGACDRLVGVTDFDDYPAQVGEVPKVVIAAQVDVERVVAAEPDLVIAAGNEVTPSAVIDQLDGLGLPVLVLSPGSVDEVAADIELVGTALDASAEADLIVADMRDRVAAVTAALDGVDGPSVLYEVFYSEGATYTAGEGSFLASLIEAAGGVPVTGDAQGAIGAEDLVAADPDVILLGTASYEVSLAAPEAALATVRARPGWSGIAAVRAGRVVPYLDDIVTTRPGPRIVDGLEALARALHPDRFD